MDAAFGMAGRQEAADFVNWGRKKSCGLQQIRITKKLDRRVVEGDLARPQHKYPISPLGYEPDIMGDH
jgi:hypothetical protein